MSKCKRCGQCCTWINYDKTISRCPYLIRLPDGKTKCKIYWRNRDGRFLGFKEVAKGSNVAMVCLDYDKHKLIYPCTKKEIT